MLHADEAVWKEAAKDGETVVYERPHADSKLMEYKAVGPIDAEPKVVKRVLDDVEAYPKFMPYVAEARVLKRSPKSCVSYQRIAPPFVGDRDYTIEVEYETRSLANGSNAFIHRWRTANHLGPAAVKGVVRVNVTEGSWQLEPAAAGRTLATYRVFSECTSAMPTSIVNMASRSAIPKVFAAVRKQARLPRYQVGQ
jgi:ribosome-associated toxin RatA of RatAB toxin-antitoxin module